MQLRGRLREDKGGVGTLIAAVFIIMIIMTGYSLSLLTSNKNQEYYNTLREMSDLDYARSRENISIKDVRITTNLKLNVTAENDGPEWAIIKWIGLFDKTQYPERDTYTSVSYSLSPGELVKGMGSSVSVSWGKNYVVQLVTDKGNAIVQTFYPANSVKCKLELLALPSSVYIGNNITVLLIITHNQTQPDYIQNVTAKLTVNPPGSVKLLQGPQQISILGLKSGSSAFFKWIYNATQTGTIYFNASYVQAPQGTYTISQVVSKVSQTPGGGSQVTITGPSTITSGSLTSYTITALSQDGSGVPYTQITVVASNLNVNIQGVGGDLWVPKGAITLPPPPGVIGEAGATGQLAIQISLTAASGTTFTLYANCGTAYSSMTVTVR